MAKATTVLTKMRTICLALPESNESETWGKPHFRVGEKIFAGCGENEGRLTIGFKTDMETANRLIRGGRFSRARYVGHHGWVSMDVAAIEDWNEVRDFVTGSYRLIAPKRALAQLDQKQRAKSDTRHAPVAPHAPPTKEDRPPARRTGARKLAKTPNARNAAGSERSAKRNAAKRQARPATSRGRRGGGS